LEEALLARFGTLRSAPANMLLRHDNGLVFGSRQYRAVVSNYGLKQEYITPYTPQQNGLCERFIKTFKEEFC
jgi:putative transposase